MVCLLCSSYPGLPTNLIRSYRLPPFPAGPSLSVPPLIYLCDDIQFCQTDQAVKNDRERLECAKLSSSAGYELPYASKGQEEVCDEPALKRSGGRSLMGTAIDSEAILVASRQRSARRLWLWGTASLVILIGFLYRDIFAALVRQWWNDPDFSHGFFVPVLAAYLVWQRRDVLASLPVKPSWWGLAVMIGAVGILLLGAFGAELFLSRSSFIFLLAGLVIFFLGWDHFRALIFPWCFVFLMVPLPTLIMNEVTLPLQFLASSLATSLLAFVGVPVLRDGNVIQLPTMSLQVVEACSGIRSLVSLITLAVVYAYLLEKNKVIRVVLVLAAVPIAIAANGLRIMGTGLTGMYWSPDKAQGFFHEFSGWLIFIMSLLMLFALHQMLRGLARWRLRRPA